MRSEKCRVVARMRPLQEGEEDCVGTAIQLPAPGRVRVCLGWVAGWVGASAQPSSWCSLCCPGSVSARRVPLR
jgi:hypothetical protein